MSIREISAEELKENTFDMIGKKWMLVTAGNKDKVNTMTASWGGLGVMWGKNVAFIVIRPTRYTKEFIDREETLSLSFYGEEYKKTLSYLGTVSGRDEDKISNAGLTVGFEEETPYFREASVVMKVKKLYAQELNPGCMLDASIDDKWYPAKDYHTMYICEVEKVLVKE